MEMPAINAMLETQKSRRRKTRPLPIVSPLERVFDGPLTQEMLLEPGRFGLGLVPQRLTPTATTNIVCGFCSTGCSLTAHLVDGEAVNLTPTADYPVNVGMACPKGWEALAPLKSSDRGLRPLLRYADGQLKETDWHSAMVNFCDRFKKIQRQHGNEAIAFLGTGQLPTEELALLGSLAKFGMGIRHGDGNTRQCMATAATAYKQSFGFDAPPFTYDDFEQSDVIFLVGSNLCIAHPIMWQRILRNPHSPRIVVVDPRTTETALCASEHLAIQPKSDLALWYGLAHLLIKQGWIDQAFIERSVSDFAAFSEFVEKFTPELVASVTGIAEDRLQQIAQLIHNGQRVSFWWTMGINQSYEGTRAAQAIINLALITGNIGRPGTGANSVTGQCNAMGSRLFSNTTNLLGGHDFSKPEDRLKVANVLGIDESLIPTDAGFCYDQIMSGIQDGTIRGLWVLGTNTAHSWINQNLCHDLLDKLDFLVVQDMYPTTETALKADLYLPAAGWGEKEGTFINSERRIGLLKKIAKAPGSALSDFSIFKLVAHYWGCGHLFEQWKDAEDVFLTLAKLSEGQPCEISGISGYQMIDDLGGIQWPYPVQQQAASANQRRLFEDGRFFHDDGKAKLLFEAPRPTPEAVCNEFPLLLLTGRGSAAQWHTNTRTGKSSVLKRLYSQQPFVEIHPADADDLEIEHYQWVEIISKRGKMQAIAVVTPTISRGQLFVPMHYEQVNRLTLDHFDPYSRQPSYKNCAVRIEKIC